MMYLIILYVIPALVCLGLVFISKTLFYETGVRNTRIVSNPFPLHQTPGVISSMLIPLLNIMLVVDYFWIIIVDLEEGCIKGIWES